MLEEKKKKKKKSSSREKLNGNFVISDHSDCLEKRVSSGSSSRYRKHKRSSSTRISLRLEKSKKENFEEALIKMSQSSPRLDASEDVLDYSPKGDSPKLSPKSMKETVDYRPYLDGQLCENKQPFDEVHFCFTCDRENEETKTPKPAIRVTGMRPYDDAYVPIYRQLFMCQTCHEDLAGKGILRMTSRAHEAYFKL